MYSKVFRNASVVNGVWQSISDLQMPKWISGTSSNTRGKLKVKITAILAVLKGATSVWENQGTVKSTGKKTICSSLQRTLLEFSGH